MNRLMRWWLCGLGYHLWIRDEERISRYFCRRCLRRSNISEECMRKHLCFKCGRNFVRRTKRFYKFCSVLCSNRSKNVGDHQKHAANVRWHNE